MTDQLIKHLSTRKEIAPVYMEYKQGIGEHGLKFMSILDFLTEKKGLYKEMSKYPKLKMQLMKLHSYETFQYYNINLTKETKAIIGDKVLKCKWCDLVGPYKLIFEHMVVSHNSHISVKDCAYCQKDRTVHKDRSMPCYEQYLQRNEIDLSELKDIIDIIEEFFMILEQFAEHFKVRINRQETYAGEKRMKKNAIAFEFGLMADAYKPKTSKKTFCDDELDKLFSIAMTQFYGGNGLPRNQICEKLEIIEEYDRNYPIEKAVEENYGITLKRRRALPSMVSDVDSEENEYHERRSLVAATSGHNNDDIHNEQNENDNEVHSNSSNASEQESDDNSQTAKEMRKRTVDHSDALGTYVTSFHRQLSENKRQKLESEIQKTMAKMSEESNE
ncbi:uncharacterized protein LOC116341361 [Contarinia nasturtii]|uniref:uncharacterized protein LOC116341361 n=1 Tax=Contarinia nasturtii TaxID=265458 RepID=UPI0012D418D4|nr:uncharacterized protein LOC116341361 [Contarinia nasturtii]